MRRRMQVLLPVLGVMLLATNVVAQEAPNTGARRARQSWTADRRDFVVGDVITVIVDEYTLASANKNEAHSKHSSRSVALAVGQNVSHTLPRSIGGELGSRNDGESRNRGESTNQNRVAGEITVRVLEVGTNGLLRVEGVKRIAVDRSLEDLVLTGFIRPEDVTAANTVDSYRIADAMLTYASKGGPGRAKGGFLSRVFGVVWP